MDKNLKNIQENFSLKKYNSLKIDAKAKLFVSIKSLTQLKKLIKENYFINNKFIIIGEGTNILFTKDFDGIVVKNDFQKDFKIRNLNNFIQINSSSGIKFDVLIQRFLKYQKENNMTIFGLENLAKIPGTVGSAVVQNIGAYGVEQKDFISFGIAIDLQTGEKEYFMDLDDKQNFGYRTSIFKQMETKYFIIEIAYSFRKSICEKPNLNYPALREKFENIDLEEITPQLVYDTVSEIRKKKLPNIKKEPNAGSFFKNPIISKRKFNSLELKYPDIVFYNFEDKIKISAAWLIEKCGLKGKRIGDVGISKKHSLILVNYGNATGKEVIGFAEFVIKTVNKKFRIMIEPEVIFV